MSSASLAIERESFIFFLFSVEERWFQLERPRSPDWVLLFCLDRCLLRNHPLLQAQVPVFSSNWLLERRQWLRQDLFRQSLEEEVPPSK